MQSQMLVTWGSLQGVPVISLYITLQKFCGCFHGCSDICIDLVLAFRGPLRNCDPKQMSALLVLQLCLCMHHCCSPQHSIIHYSLSSASIIFLILLILDSVVYSFLFSDERANREHTAKAEFTYFILKASRALKRNAFQRATDQSLLFIDIIHVDENDVLNLVLQKLLQCLKYCMIFIPSIFL